MRSFVIRPISHLKGEIGLIGDKSIGHRSIILSAIGPGQVVIKNFPANEDCLSTIGAFKKLGVKIIREPKKSSVTVIGRGLWGLRKPKDPIFLSDSGTTLRLILGILAGQKFSVKLTAGKSLSGRPMRRVTEPLRRMGAIIRSKVEEYPPITIRGGNLRAIAYRMPVASAQVKSAILLAGLYACGVTNVIEPISTRDHTERMLKLFKAGIKVRKNLITIEGNRELVSPAQIIIPADISSAAFFIVAASILPDSEILIKNVSLNPARIGILRVLKRMGADIKVISHKSFACKQAKEVISFEPMGDLVARSGKLKGCIVTKDEIPSLIDELPILMVAACFARGKTIFKNVEELRVKETDRIQSMVENLSKMGAKIQVVKTAESENIVIEGTKELFGAKVKSFGDHRTAMSMIIAGLKAEGQTQIDDVNCINKSFPGFVQTLKSLIR